MGLLAMLPFAYLLRLGPISGSYAVRTSGGLCAPLLALGAVLGLWFGKLCALALAANGGLSVPCDLRCGHSCRYITNASTWPVEGCLKAPGRRPTISNPSDCQSLTARSFVLTTKLNCMAR